MQLTQSFQECVARMTPEQYARLLVLQRDFDMV